MRQTALLLLATAATGLSQPPRREVAVIAHRGEHVQHTENTLGAFRAAIEAGADYFEVDVRTTSDGRLVLMHDGHVDRTTNGKGPVAGFTFAEIRALRAGTEQIPTFEESLVLARGKGQVYVDVKNASPEALLAALESTGMTDRVVVYAGLEYLKRLQSMKSSIRVMPESVSVPVMHRILNELKPKVIAFSASDWQDDIIKLARDAGADLFVDRLGKDDNSSAWQDAVDRGATGIQTDHPAELVKFLSSKGLHRK
jgi:glycerophosphoryl diester phosphodiesterase